MPDSLSDTLRMRLGDHRSSSSRKTPRTDDHGPIHGALWNVCRKAIDLQPKDSDTARTFFEQNFQPVRIARLGEVKGFLTGYFEPIVQGSPPFGSR